MSSSNLSLNYTVFHMFHKQSNKYVYPYTDCSTLRINC